ncbi:MAG: hypothetical protein LBI54_04860 [Lachnospiraceae bacterium]|jgi:hypothetical protein|nr:hypothetical protein [Lachnospiraceae bacterium]
MFDADKELNDIIVKYDIDRQNRRFREYVRATELLNQLAAEYGDILFVASHPMGVQWLRQDLQGFDGEIVIVDVLNEESFAGMGEGKTVVLASYHFQGEMSVILKRMGIKHICLYDHFLRHGLALDHEYNDIFGQAYIDVDGNKRYDFYEYSPYLGIINLRSKMAELAEGDVLAKVFRERVIFALLYIRDFVTAQKHIDEYLALYSEDTVDYGAAWQEIEGLLGQLKERLGERGQRDIIVFLLDALEPGNAAEMPFLKAFAEHSLVFENSYTVTPFTNPTLRTLFAGQRVVEDRSFEILSIAKENSPLIEELEAKGFDFRAYGHTSGRFEEALRGRHSTALAYSPMSMVYWNALRDLANSHSPCFVWLHEMFETHAPRWSPELENFYFKGNYNAATSAENVAVSRKYVDRQLEFYSSFLPDRTVKICMSDHGNTMMGKWHTLLMIQAAGVPQKAERRLFSYLDFGKLIDYITAPADSKYNGLFREAIGIQDLDFYYGPVLFKKIKTKRFLDVCIGYQGTVTEKDIYIRHNNGLEFFHKHKNDGTLFAEERLEYLRGITSAEKLDVWTEKKLECSRNTYKVLEKYHQRNHEYEERKTAALKKLFNKNNCSRGGCCRPLPRRDGGLSALAAGGAYAMRQRPLYHRQRPRMSGGQIGDRGNRSRAAFGVWR